MATNTKNKEWANKMAECRRQKQIDTKKKFEDVGAHIISIPNKYTYNIVANENISTKALFALYDGYFWFCDITDDKGEKLLKITLKRYSCKIEFLFYNKNRGDTMYALVTGASSGIGRDIAVILLMIILRNCNQVPREF